MSKVRLLTVEEVAEWLNVSKGWVRDHATGRRAPHLPCVRLGKAIRFEEPEIDAWLAKLPKRAA